jgi:putative transposase
MYAISKTKMKNAAIAAKSAALPKIPKELLDQFVSGPMTGEAVRPRRWRSRRR